MRQAVGGKSPGRGTTTQPSAFSQLGTAHVQSAPKQHARHPANRVPASRVNLKRPGPLLRAFSTRPPAKKARATNPYAAPPVRAAPPAPARAAPSRSAISETQAGGTNEARRGQATEEVVNNFYNHMCQICFSCLEGDCSGRDCYFNRKGKVGFRCVYCGKKSGGSGGRHIASKCPYNYKFKCHDCGKIVTSVERHKMSGCECSNYHVVGHGYVKLSDFLAERGVCSICFDWHGPCTSQGRPHRMNKRMWELLVRESMKRGESFPETVMHVFQSQKTRNDFIAGLPEFHSIRQQYSMI